MSLLFNMPSRLVIAFLPRSKCLLISWMQSPSAVTLEPKKKVYHCFHSICHEVMGPDAMILVFWMLSFKQTFHSPLSLSSRGCLVHLHFLLYLRLLIFLLAILIPACDLSSPAFHIMYSAYKLNKQGDYIQPWRTLFPIGNQSVVSCPVLTVASWPAYRFLRK